MKNNRSELLDDEDVPVQKKATSTLIAISCLYVVIMFVGGFICSIFDPDCHRFSQRVEGALVFFIMSFFITVLSGILRVVFSNKDKKKEEQDKEPLWYRFVVEVFSVWIILTLLTLVKLLL